MKYKIFNTITAMVGIRAMVNHILEAGNNASLGTIAFIWLATFVVSLVGTIVMATIDTNIQNRKEKEYARMLYSAYRAK